MLSKLTTSEKILTGCLLLFLAGVIQFAYAVSTHMVDKVRPCGDSFEIGKGDIYRDTLTAAYHHLYVTFSEIQLQAQLEHEVHIEGYENVRELMKMYVQNDTLYIAPMTECSPKPVKAIGHGAIEVKVGAVGLKSITLAKMAEIRTPVRAIGENKEGWLKYRQEDLDQYQIKFDSLELNLYDRAKCNLLVNGSKLTINSPNATTLGNTISGECDILEMAYESGMLYIGASNLRAKNVVINRAKNRGKQIRGSITVYASESLEANLYEDLDVFYKGSPKIIKEETGLGRVVNLNGFEN